jgi:hypothetical protein
MISGVVRVNHGDFWVKEWLKDKWVRWKKEGITFESGLAEEIDLWAT